MVRGEKEHLTAFRRYYSRAIAILDQLDVMVGITERELIDVKIVRETLQAYNDNIAIIDQAHAEQLPIVDIDAMVDIDDRRALAAINRVIASPPFDAQLWFAVTSASVDQHKRSAIRHAEHIRYRLQNLIDDAYRALMYWSVSFAVFFLASLGLSFSFTGNDKIALVKRTFNSLVENLHCHWQCRNRHKVELQRLIKIQEIKQRLIDRDEELAKQVFAKIIQSGGQDQLYVNSWIKPMASFNGDLMTLANSDEGLTYVMMCDFTGHGLPAALGALPASSVFYPMARKGRSIPNIVNEINKKLLDLLPVQYFCCAAILVLDHDTQSCSR